jgi:hypothetical protein
MAILERTACGINFILGLFESPCQELSIELNFSQFERY